MLVAKYTFYHEWHTLEQDAYGFFSTPLFDFVYLWLVVPAQLLCFGAICIFMLSLGIKALRSYRSMCIVLSCTLIFGSGFITHFLLKEYWGRPRPRQIVDFGGQQQFRPYYKPFFGKTPEPSKSFPSGHSTCGFYFFCLYFLFKRMRLKSLAFCGMSLGMSLGLLLSLARIAQGGHFISDIIFSALIMWYAALCIDWLTFDARFLSKIRAVILADDLLAGTKSRDAYQT